MLLGFLKESLFYLIFYTALAAIIITDKFITKKNKNIFIIAIILGIINLAVNYIEIWSASHPEVAYIREWASYTGYSLRPFLILCYLKLFLPKYKHIIYGIVATINLIMYYTSHFTHLCVYFKDGRTFQRGPLGIMVFIICGIGLALFPVMSITMNYKRNIRRWILPPVCSVLILHAVYTDLQSSELLYPTSLNTSLVIVMLLFYLYHHLQLAEQYEEKTVQNQQLQLMISQIKPHFFFNTITTIQALCVIDPQKASDTLRNFASYVRQNINTQTENLIPFSKEIQHVKTYVDIETLRFPNIEIQYDLQTTDFDIAALSIQPLVENAIKHGIRSREHGIVVISTRQQNDTIIVTISDNGIGFDTNTIDTLDNSHVGIRNVQSRLKILQDATMKINSTPEGTTITITIRGELI